MSNMEGAIAAVMSDNKQVEIHLNLAFVQSSWVTNFVKNGATSPTSIRDEDLLIVLPG